MSFDQLSFDRASFDPANPVAVSFSPASFSVASFTVIGQTTPPIVGGGKGKRNRFRAWLKSLQKFVSRFFIKKKKREEEPEIEEIVLPPAQPPAGKTVTILDQPLEEVTVPLVPLSSAVASTPPPQPEIYPLILNPLSAPIIQTRIALPIPITQRQLGEPYRVGEGSHIESDICQIVPPKNRAKAASIISTVMMLMEMEQQLEIPMSQMRQSRSKAGGAGIAVALLKRQELKKRILRVRFTTQHDAKVDDEICARLDGKEWDIDDPFIIVPPELTHPNCRCTLKRVNNGNQRVWVPPEFEDLLQYVEDVGLRLDE